MTKHDRCIWPLVRDSYCYHLEDDYLYLGIFHWAVQLTVCKEATAFPIDVYVFLNELPLWLPRPH